MGFRINTNIQSLNAQRNLGINNEKTAVSLAKLSSGSRITKSSDDAAGLSISEKLKANIRGLQQANRNASDGVSMIQTAEGGINEISNILIRLRELSVQASSDTIGDVERSFSNKEYQSLVKEISRISEVTNYNGHSLLNGKGEKLEIQVGIMNSAENDRLVYNMSDTDLSTDQLMLSGTTISQKSSAQNNLETIDNAIVKANENRSALGALQNRLGSTINNLSISAENLSAANSRVRDADFALESSELTKNSIVTQAATAVLSQANSSQNLALKLL